MREFFEGYHVTPQDVYSKKATVTGLAVQADLLKGYRTDPERERLLVPALGRLSFINSRRWIRFLQAILPQIRMGKGMSAKGMSAKGMSAKGVSAPTLSAVERTMLVMFYYTLWGKGLDDLSKRFASIEEAIYWLIDDPLLYSELMDLLEYQYLKIDFVDKPLAELAQLEKAIPLDLYCSYTLEQILAALGKHTEKRKSPFREGVLYLADQQLDVFFVTLNKSEKDYSPSTLYQDYSINEELFHWQSQSRTTEESITGQRYINQSVNGGNVLFFVREYKKEASFASPFTCLGFADYQSHYGSAPISIVWKMKVPMPGFVMKKTVKV